MDFSLVASAQLVVPPPEMALPGCRWVRLEAESGAVGLGEICGGGPQDELEETVEALGALATGRSAGAREALWARMRAAASEWDENPALDTAVIVAFDMAAWELMARELGQPPVTLMGGTVRHRVEACVEIDGADREAATQEAGWWSALGVRQFCLVVPGAEPGDLATARQVRRAVGQEALLALRVASPLGEAEAALAAGQALDRLEPFWVEGLLADGMWRELATLRKSVVAATAAGGMTLGPERLRRALEQGSADTLTPRLAHCAGPTGLLRLADAADLYGVRIAVGAGDSVLSVLMAGQLAAGRLAVSPVLVPAATGRLLAAAYPEALAGGFVSGWLPASGLGIR